MTTSLYDLSVASYLQIVPAVEKFLEKARAHFVEAGVDPDTLVTHRLYDNMAPLSFQIVSVAHHSIDAIEGVKLGVFGPPTATAPSTYVGLQAMIAEAKAALEALTPAEVDGYAGKDVTFQMGDFKIPFTAETFVLSFSLPNFYFHATTAYDLLRMKGAPFGKRDFLGAMRMKI
jgi:hypothetical protein